MKTQVLLIEDDAIDRELVHRAIGSHFTVTDAEEGYAGLHIARAQRPACVLLDYRLPDINGIELLPELVKEDIPVVMLTGIGNEAIAVNAMKLGAQDYVSKEEMSSAFLQKVILRAVETVRLKCELAEQRMELESFVSVASHDLRAPLRHILRFAELARTECIGKVSDEVDEYLGSVVDGGKRMANLLDALVEFSRSGLFQKVLGPVPLMSVVEQATENLYDLIAESRAIIQVTALPTVRGHEVSLIELLQNLIGNAIKYAGKKVPRICIDATQVGNCWTIAVRDNGIGIDADNLGCVFLPFRRLHSYGDIAGSGIGLATCSRIVKHHQGTIWVESEPERGSSFLFTLMAVEESRASTTREKADLWG